MPKLAICIPTYNRSAALNENLAHLADLASRHDIIVHVSDNCSDDDTQQVVRHHADRCDRIRYSRNATNLGMDGNFAAALKLSDSPLTWLLGDDDLVAEAALQDILGIGDEKQYDLILLNGGSEQADAGRVRGEPSRDFDDPQGFMTELGWHATWISGLVIGRTLLQQMRVDKHDGTYFSHFIALFEALSTIPSPQIRWYAQSSFHPSSLASFSWSKRVIEVFADKWSKAVWRISGDYDPESRRRCIMAHGVRTGLFTPVGMLNIRAKGGLSLEIARQYRSALAEASPCPWWLILAISMLPRPALNSVRGVAMAIRSHIARSAIG